ncbi:MAG: D-alanyl-D-alanine carboxypeptidase [Halieaceae bacterium]|jgi:D-alanyl-D-alanine carboxypeptidase
MGMESSRLHVVGHVPVSNEASGHRWDEALQQHTKDTVVTLPVTAPDGGLVTTLDDFYRWSRLYVDPENPVLAQNSVRRMPSPVVETGEIYARGAPTWYGYGLFLGDGLIIHEGYIVGFRSHFILDPERDLLIVVFSNNTTSDPTRISAGMLEILDAM